MKYRWLKKDAIRVPYKTITKGGLPTGEEIDGFPILEEGIEVEFEGEATPQQLADLDRGFTGLRREGGGVKDSDGVVTDIPRSTHVSVLTAVNAPAVRPATIKRVWEGNDYFFDCFVTQTVRDEYVEGKIVIGDFVLVHFDDIGEQLVQAKVFKSW